jgi:DNA-binding transcriptional ArsR family regulator
MNLPELAPKSIEAEEFLKALANRHRLMILCELLDGELAVSALQRRLGLSQSSLSQHLARLRADELVKTRRESQAIFYSLANPSVSRMMELLYQLFCAEPCAPDAKSVKRNAGEKSSCAMKISNTKGRVR